MTVPMVGPGPLVGGPKSSPGSAKSEETFSAHLKQACDQPKGKGATPSLKSSDQQPGSVPSEPSPQTRPDDSRPPSSEKGLAAPLASKAPVDATAEEPSVESPLSDSNEISIPPGTTNLTADPVIPTAEAESPKGFDQILMAVIPRGEAGNSVAPPTDNGEDTSADSESGTVEEPLKVEPKSVDIPAPLLIPLTVVLPTPAQEPPVQGEPGKDSPLLPVGPVPLKGAALSLEASTPGPTKAINEGEKKPDTIPANHSKDLTDRTKDAGPIPLSLPLDPNDKRTGDRPDLQNLLKGSGKETPTVSSEKGKGDQKAEAVKETSSGKEAPLPLPLVQPEEASSVPLATETLAKLKEISSIAPLRSSSPGTPGGTATEMAQSSIPPTVSNGAPAESARSATPPVLAPSPVDLARQIHVHLESGRSVVRIDLHPDHLGELRISMETKGKDVSMQFTVDNETARTAVVAGLREITGTLSSLGWSVNGLAVNVSTGGPGNGRGESSGPIWGQGLKMPNDLPLETVVASPKAGAGGWRVDLVA